MRGRRSQAAIELLRRPALGPHADGDGAAAPRRRRGPAQREEGVEAGPVARLLERIQPAAARRVAGARGASCHLKIAVITGLIGFLIAAAALTLPELIFGGSVGGGDRDTTYFGGGSSSKDKGESQDGKSDGQTDQPSGERRPARSAGSPEATGRPGDERGGDPPTAGRSAPDDSTEPAPSTQPPSDSARRPRPRPLRRRRRLRDARPERRAVSCRACESAS